MFGTRVIKKFIGFIIGYDTCPNCNAWTKDSFLDYRECVSETYIETNGIVLCQKCKSNPETLDPIKIREALEKSDEFEEGEINLIVDFVENYKNEQ